MSIMGLCELAGMSRQNFYKARHCRQRRRVDSGLIRELVLAERKLHPRIGGLKLHVMLKKKLASTGIKLGRDRFFAVLKEQDLLVQPLPKAPRTTNSNHSLPVYTNIAKNHELTGANQVWVSDITYIRTRENFAYLSLVTDKHSHKIVGYHVGRTLKTEDTLNALKMAVSELPEGVFPIHHSDRGSQYCSHEYVSVLKSNGLGVSMTEENHCAENALAERMNGILKQEYSLSCEFRTISQVRRAVKQAVWLYNTRRPHRSLKMRTPEQVHNSAA